MTGKEALQILFASYNYYGNYQEVIEAREKLEQDLERLEKLEKAIEVFKKTLVVFKQGDCFMSYNIDHFDENEITKEESEILKEVFESDYKRRIEPIYQE